MRVAGDDQSQELDMNTGKLFSKFKRDTTPKPEPESDRQVFGKKLGLINRLVGCTHKDLGRPFANGKIAYRSCVKCGARRPFDPDTFETYGNYYCPPVNQL
jgi:hypothetical protein